MPGAKYRFVYKCRMCGKNYDDGAVDRKGVLQNLSNATSNSDGYPYLFSVHMCDEKKYGIGDLQGALPDPQ